jgi:outer membrane lipoprotein-sorting protein
MVNRFLRTASTQRLLATLAAVVVMIAGGSAIAVAATSGGPIPKAKPLATAIRDALAAKPVQGISATVNFTNNLFPGSEIQGTDPLLTGGSGRVWVSNDGRIRLELSGENGDPEIVVTHTTWWIYDPTLNTVYEGTLPSATGWTAYAPRHARPADAHQLPTVAQIQTELDQLAMHLDISGAIPTDVGGQPAYTVKFSPKSSGGLIGQIQLAWDALEGVPLRFAVYARGDSSPVLELAASGVSYGPIGGDVFNIKPPSGAHVVSIASPSGAGASDHTPAKKGKDHTVLTGVKAVARHLPFTLAAPQTAGGMTLSSASLLGGARHGALLVYGHGLGAVAVIEEPASSGAQQQLNLSSGSGDHANGLALPTVSINGASGQQLDTALGTVLRYSSAGVDYTVLGSVRPNVADAVARGL